MTSGTVVSRNCALFLDRLDQVVERCGRKREDITVVAVSKTRTIAEIEEAFDCGFREFGESKVLETQSKYAGVDRRFKLHMIGHLQSNKAETAAKLFDVIQSVDSLKLARILAEEFGLSSKVGEILLEVNCSGEQQKFGFSPSEVVTAAHQIFDMEQLTLCGLMTVAPFTEETPRVRKAFQELRQLFEKIKSSHSDRQEFNTLSMGMSDDFEIAIEEGSNMIRIGTAIFGPRVYQ